MKTRPHFFLFSGSVFAFALLACVSVVNAQGPPKNTSGPAFHSALEAEVIDEINGARANPRKYAGYMEEYKKYYNGKSYLPPSRKKPVTTSDGVAAVDEAVRFLQANSPLGPLQPSQGLSFAARDHAKDLAQKGVSGHRGSDGSLPNDRISRYGKWKTTVGEAIVYRVSTAREMVLELIIDDGIADRPHRKNIFEPNFQIAGVSISPASEFGSFCVVVYAGGLVEKAGLKATATTATPEVKTPAPTTKAPAKSTGPATKTPKTKRTP